MEKEMLEQIQQMITTAAESLRRDFRQDMAGIATGLDQKMTGLAGELRQEMAGMEARLGERIDETKRHSGVLVEGLRH